MPNDSVEVRNSVGAWAKRYFFAGRAVAESMLRPFDIGWTQWHVLFQLASNGPTMQREIGRRLEVERATLSGVVASLVRKGLIDQAADSTDQRQRMLRLTEDGELLWTQLPNPIELILPIAFDGIPEADLAIARQVLQTATQRLTDHHDQQQGTNS